MILKLEDFSCFRANWDNKADNIVQIAKTLNLGLESFVFVDDNPAERALIRRELPMVAVPELPEDPALYIDCLARAHYFDAIAISAEDKQRTQQYLAEEKRRVAAADARDLDGFLNSLEMKILVNGYRSVDLIRITQLINKTNQFNLTTRRYTESEVRSLAGSDDNIILSARVEDRFGDNGLISVVIAKRPPDDSDFVVDTWLMSCRVLGRNVEQALMKTLVGIAQARGARQLRGVYLPTPKNKMVEDFYAKQGFSRANTPNGPDGATWWDLDLDTYAAPNIHGTLEVTLDA
jgi:FkbH-like protein